MVETPSASSPTPPNREAHTATVNFIDDPDHLPADANIPDNYVSYTLKHQKSLPPVTRENFLNELNWLHVGILGLSPLLGLVGAFFTPLKWQTALWSVVYYFMTGLGEW